MKKLIFAIAVAAAGAAAAEVSFSYQGALKTATGGDIPPEQSNKTISFRLYDTPTGPEAIWGRALAVHLDANGLFNVELSDTAGSPVTGNVKTNELAAVLSQYPNLYIGLDVQNSTGEIRPRQKLLNVPTAAFAADVSKAKNGFTVESGTATFNDPVVAKSTMTVEGKLTANTGVDVTDGGLTVSKGNLSVKNGGLSVSGGSLSIGTGITIDPNGDAGKGIIPSGVIVMWSGDANKIPAGWALCDGNNNTPNLKDRFIVGAGGKYPHKSSGGEETVTLNASQTPLREHSHEYWGDQYQKYIKKGREDGTLDGKFDSMITFTGMQKMDYTYRYVTSNASNNDVAPHNNIPPYYALCFIMKK